jgi:hypothetical protein
MGPAPRKYRPGVEPLEGYELLAGTSPLGAIALAQTVNLVPTVTTLSTPASTVAPGQLVTVTAVVSPAQAGGTPTGGVEFYSLGNMPVIDPIVVPLVLVGGQAEALFSIAVLDAGTHAINAGYTGDSQFAPSVAPPLTVPVTGNSTPTPPQPPTIVALGHKGAGLTSITLSFGVALVPSSAQDASLYRALGHVPDRATGDFRRKLAIKSVRYSAAAQCVTIALARPHRGPVHVEIQAGLRAADDAASASAFAVIAG